SRSGRGVIIAVVAMASQLGGCGPSEFVARRTASHVYRAPCAALVPAVRDVLRDRGYEPVPAVRDMALVMQTAWRTDEPPPKFTALPRHHRYRAWMVPTDTASCRLRVLRDFDGLTEPSTERALEVEWEVLRRAEPATARRIEADSRRRPAPSSPAD